jgi:hypothetical protein
MGGQNHKARPHLRITQPGHAGIDNLLFTVAARVTIVILRPARREFLWERRNRQHPQSASCHNRIFVFVHVGLHRPPALCFDSPDRRTTSPSELCPLAEKVIFENSESNQAGAGFINASFGLELLGKGSGRAK